MLVRLFTVHAQPAQGGLQVTHTELVAPHLVNAQTGDGTWRGPNSGIPHVIDYGDPHPTLEKTNYVLNSMAARLQDLAPELHTRLTALETQERCFLKVSDKQNLLDQAAKDLRSLRRLPQLNTQQIHLILGAARFLRDEPHRDFGYTIGEALLRTYITTAEDIRSLAYENLGSANDLTKIPFFALIVSALEAHGGDFDELHAQALQDLPLVDWLQQWPRVRELADRFRKVGRAHKDDPFGPWLALGQAWEQDFILSLLKEYGSVQWSEFSIFHSLTKPNDPSRQVEAVFRLWEYLSQGREQEIQGYTSYLYHQPPVERRLNHTSVRLAGLVTTPFAYVAAISMREHAGSYERALLIRLRHPENEKRDDVFLIRLDQDTEHFRLGELDRKLKHPPSSSLLKRRRRAKAQVLSRLGSHLIEDVMDEPRLADSRGKLYSAADLISDFTQDPKRFTNPIEPLELKGFTALTHPDLLATSSTGIEERMSFNNLFFVQTGQAVILTRTTAEKSETFLVIRDVENRVFTIARGNQSPVRVSFSNLRRADTDKKATIEAASHFLMTFGFMDRLPAGI